MCVFIKKNIFHKWCLCGYIFICRFYVTKLNYIVDFYWKENGKLINSVNNIDETESDMQHPIK